MTPQPVRAVVVGAGNRGREVYGGWALAHPDKLKIVAVAEPRDDRREAMASAHRIPPDRQFRSWEELLVGKEKLAEVAIITTQDQMHVQPATAALESGYDVLLEKPMAHEIDGCIQLVRASERTGRILQIAHVLRYTDFFQKLYEILQSERLGQVITISHRENVSSWHMAHSFVRGNWRNKAQSSPMILAKSCHDMDVLYWLVGRRVERLSSTGSLRHFRAENAPEGAPERCLDGCPVAETCPFYAPAFYIELRPILKSVAEARNPFNRAIGRLIFNQPGLTKPLSRVVSPLRKLADYSGWPRSVITEEPASVDALYEALRTGPYGRCVYHCDNDVVDHQVVAMEFEGGISASFTMHGHSHEEGRTIRIDGSQATLLGKFGWNRMFIDIHDHRKLGVERIIFPNSIESGGHGGGDGKLMQAFVNSVRNGEQTPLTSARASLESHLMAFATEKARLEGVVVPMQAFRRDADKTG